LLRLCQNDYEGIQAPTYDRPTLRSFSLLFATFLSRLVAQVRTLGVRRSLSLAAQHRLRRRLSVYASCAPLVEARRCLEIGGPSPLFARDGLLPLYPLAETVDNCTFAHRTLWQGDVLEGRSFRYDVERVPGQQFIAEATDLAGIEDGTYGAVLASHVIEHVANPLRALSEWARVLNEDGTLVLVVPHRETTFDHRRPLTTIEHLVADFERGVGEDDPTHVSEFLALIDLERDPEGRSREQLAALAEDFVGNRFVHHHVFDSRLVVELLDRARFQLVALATALPFHVVVIARRPRDGVAPANDAFLAPNAAWARASCFRTDRALR
jgi:SAM-dependent methyltransferase